MFIEFNKMVTENIFFLVLPYFNSQILVGWQNVLNKYDVFE